jgi:two-component sensor histidine kinase
MHSNTSIKNKRDKYSSIFEGKEISKLMDSKSSPWKVIIADKNDEIHFNTNLMFAKYFSHDGRDIQLFSCYNYQQVMHNLKEHPDTAVILLDTNLEDGKSGIEFIGKIREVYGYDMVRIIVHGLSEEELSERDTIIKYDISDYKGKVKINIPEIFISIVSSLGAYRDKKIKEILFKEVHHRVKNNLQIIQSILSLQSQYVNNPEFVKEMKEGINRIQTIANIHKNLYEEENIARVNFSKYVRNLIISIFRNFKKDYEDIDPKVNIKDNLTLDIDHAIPCGLIINELVSNSLKYAFKGKESGKIVVGINEFEEGFYKLIISDNGCGMDNVIDFQNTASLGFELVSLLVAQLGGTIKMETSKEEGTQFIIYFTEIS